ncbi:MAG: hypothetical protein JNK43_04550 [Ignavibacteria bacterium]|nr:hypothetical protein [Ignavibacteria bacterium]
MYQTLLTVHSLVRWIALAMLVYLIIRAYSGWLSSGVFTSGDSSLRKWTISSLHLQLILGIILYFVSPITTYFMSHFCETVGTRSIRFFGMEHVVMMLAAIVIATIGAARSKRRPEDRLKFKTLAIWLTISLILILAAMPWPFAQAISRPWFRLF